MAQANPFPLNDPTEPRCRHCGNAIGDVGYFALTCGCVSIPSLDRDRLFPRRKKRPA